MFTTRGIHRWGCIRVPMNSAKLCLIGWLVFALKMPVATKKVINKGSPRPKINEPCKSKTKIIKRKSPNWNCSWNQSHIWWESINAKKKILIFQTKKVRKSSSNDPCSSHGSCNSQETLEWTLNLSAANSSYAPGLVNSFFWRWSSHL